MTGELSSTKVTVIAGAPAGFTPKYYAPPGYHAPQGGDYNKTMGLLENGNQRQVTGHSNLGYALMKAVVLLTGFWAITGTLWVRVLPSVGILFEVRLRGVFYDHTS